jgi:hypothetical protein
MGRHGAELIKDGQTVLTHCNAGALATAGYGTALGVIRAAWEQGKKINVIADETRPVLQGARLTVWELMQDRIPVTLITDNMAGALMRQGKIDLCVVGADRIAADSLLRRCALFDDRPPHEIGGGHSDRAAESRGGHDDPRRPPGRANERRRVQSGLRCDACRAHQRHHHGAGRVQAPGVGQALCRLKRRVR